MSELKRSLKARHLNMISLGGAIGTGLFLASGSTIAEAGPGGALVAYAVIGAMVYFLMTSLGEMATYLPVSGSFSTYASRYVDSAFGFATGWNYWYNWAITLAFELCASAVIMKYWFPNVPAIVFVLIFLVIIFAINAISVKGFGELEFLFASTKVITVIIFLIVGVAMIVTPFASGPVGLGNYMSSGHTFHNGFAGIFAIFVVAGFSFQGTELVGIASGETKDPTKDIPKAIKQISWRILMFYILTIFIIGALIAFDNPQLLVTDDVATSPFTLVFERIGIPVAASLMNAVILVAVLSAGNSGTYASSRMLYDLAKSGNAPKIFSKVSKRGVPIFALLATAFVGALACLSSFFGEGEIYTWLLNLSALTGFISWCSIAISHYRFRRGYVKQGKDIKDLPYRAKLFPFGPLLALGACLIVIFGQNYEAFLSGVIDWTSMAATYIGIPIFLIIYFGYKIVKKTKIVKLSEMDLSKQ